MLHLPKEGATVAVWPAPGRFVVSQPPRDDAPHVSQMSADGQAVVWNGFRYRQYLAGDLHFFDPRPKDSKGELAEHEKAHADRMQKHRHAPRHHQYLPAEALAQLQKQCAHPGEHRKDAFCDLCGAADADKAKPAEKAKE